MAPTDSDLSGRPVVMDVFRFLPDEETEPRFQRYEIPYRDDDVVLDALNHIKAEVDATLSVRLA